MDKAQVKYTIEDLRNGTCSLINDGTVYELNSVLILAFPDDELSISNKNDNQKYFFKLSNGCWGCSDETLLPKQSVKDFLYPIIMEVSYFVNSKIEDQFLNGQGTIPTVKGLRDIKIKQIDPEIIEAMSKVDYEFYEQGMLDYIASLNLQGVAIDIGAHVGNHTVYFATKCGFSRIEAFEPNPEAFDVLVENTNGMPVVAREVALSYRKKFNAKLVPDLKDRSGRTKVDMSQKGNVVCLTLDGIFNRYNGKISLIKIDVEGMEVDVLKGGKSIIEDHLPHLFVEHFGNPSDILQYLPKGYKVGKRFNGAPTYHYYYAE